MTIAFPARTEHTDLFMRMDKLTTKFQQAFADAQSLAVGQDNQFIEPVHLLREACTKAVDRLPKVEGHGGEVQLSRELSNLLNLTDREAQKKGDQFIASELFVLALINDKGVAE